LVAIQETIKHDFSDLELKELARNKDFGWFWVPARGHSGCLLTSVNVEDFEIEQTHYGTFFLGVLIRNRSTNYKFWVLNIYGPAHHNISEEFIQEV
jgi:hypothetical protein